MLCCIRAARIGGGRGVRRRDGLSNIILEYNTLGDTSAARPELAPRSGERSRPAPAA